MHNYTRTPAPALAKITGQVSMRLNKATNYRVNNKDWQQKAKPMLYK